MIVGAYTDELIRRRGLCGEVATIVVGPEHIKFTVHEMLLVTQSVFFRKALRGPFQESEARTVQLPEVDRLQFEHFVFWLYNSSNTPDDSLLKRFGSSIGTPSIEDLVDLYNFADFLDCEALKTDITSAVEDLNIPAERLPDSSTVHYVWENSNDAARFRSVVVKRFVEFADETTFRQAGLSTDYPPSFWCLVADNHRGVMSKVNDEVLTLMGALEKIVGIVEGQHNSMSGPICQCSSCVDHHDTALEMKDRVEAQGKMEAATKKWKQATTKIRQELGADSPEP